MDFPDMNSLLRAAQIWKFRQPVENETEEEFRSALADHVQPNDLVESMEIRTKKGWDKFSDEDNCNMIRRNSEIR